MDNTERIEQIKALNIGDIIRLLPDEEDGFPAIDVTYKFYDSKHDILIVSTEEHGMFEVDAVQFSHVVRRV